MSIINDALKKTQQNLQGNQSTGNPPKNQMNETPSNDNSQQPTQQPPPSKPPQQPNVPDMSKFIPQKEKPATPPPPPDLAGTKGKKGLTKNLIKTETEKTPETPVKIIASILISVIIFGAAGLIAYRNLPVLSGKQKNSIKPDDLKRKITRAVDSLPIPGSDAKSEKRYTPPPPPPPGVLIASGIVDMGDHKVALINNNIYEIGDTVEGWTLTGISLDQVEVKKGEESQILKVPK